MPDVSGAPPHTEQNLSEQPGGGHSCPRYPSHPDSPKSHTANAELHSDHNMPKTTHNIVAVFKRTQIIIMMPNKTVLWPAKRREGRVTFVLTLNCSCSTYALTLPTFVANYFLIETMNLMPGRRLSQKIWLHSRRTTILHKSFTFLTLLMQTNQEPVKKI